MSRELLEKAAACLADDWCDRWKKELLEELDAELAKPDAPIRCLIQDRESGEYYLTLPYPIPDDLLKDIDSSKVVVEYLYGHPQRQQEPLSGVEIELAYNESKTGSYLSFAAGVRYSEKRLGIGGEK